MYKRKFAGVYFGIFYFFVAATKGCRSGLRSYLRGYGFTNARDDWVVGAGPLFPCTEEKAVFTRVFAAFLLADNVIWDVIPINKEFFKFDETFL